MVSIDGNELARALTPHPKRGEGTTANYAYAPRPSVPSPDAALGDGILAAREFPPPRQKAWSRCPPTRPEIKPAPAAQGW